jgi:hypothetical protein
MKLLEEYTEGGVDVLRLAGEIDMHFGRRIARTPEDESKVEVPCPPARYERR